MCVGASVWVSIIWIEKEMGWKFKHTATHTHTHKIGFYCFYYHAFSLFRIRTTKFSGILFLCSVTRRCCCFCFVTPAVQDVKHKNRHTVKHRRRYKIIGKSFECFCVGWAVEWMNGFAFLFPCQRNNTFWIHFSLCVFGFDWKWLLFYLRRPDFMRSIENDNIK